MYSETIPCPGCQQPMYPVESAPRPAWLPPMPRAPGNPPTVHQAFRCAVCRLVVNEFTPVESTLEYCGNCGNDDCEMCGRQIDPDAVMWV